MKNIILFVAIICYTGIYAQKNFMKEADAAFSRHEYFTAAELYKKAFNSAKKYTKYINTDICFQLGECYRMLNDYKAAEQWYAKSAKLGYSTSSYMLLADMQKRQGKYIEAIDSYKQYKALSPTATNDFIESCELSLQWIKEYEMYCPCCKKQ